MTHEHRSHSDDRWTLSGCRSLTGHPRSRGADPPEGFVPALDQVASRLRTASATVGHAVEIDLLDELALRARVVALRRRGSTSCGGGSRLLRCIDGVVAITLARPTDVELVPALIEDGSAPDGTKPTDPESMWDELVTWTHSHSAHHVVERARLLGLAAGTVVAAPSIVSAALTPIDVTRHTRPPGRPTVRNRPPRVLDLSALWAGPLCGRLLGLAGADVVKVECVTRPDGARRGSRAVWNHLHEGHRSVALDLTRATGRSRLASLLAAADLVIESSRPRALAAWGLSPDEVTGPAVWISITAYGYRGPQSDRVGFGDDVAAAAGLVVDDVEGPWFFCDAVADPLTGAVAATLALESLAREQRVHLDVAMHDVARQFAGRSVTQLPDTPDPSPHTDITENLADAECTDRLPLGGDNDDVLAQWCS